LLVVLCCLFHIATVRLFNDIDFSRDIENFQLQLNTYGGFFKTNILLLIESLMNRKSSILFHFGRLYAVQNAGFSRLLGLAFSTFSQFRATRLTDGDIWHSEWLNKSLC